MEQGELELLQKVLPDGMELVKHTDGGWSTWDPEHEWQLPLDAYATAKQVMQKILVTREAVAFRRGQVDVDTKVCDALGINLRIKLLREEMLKELDAIANKNR